MSVDAGSEKLGPRTVCRVMNTTYHKMNTVVPNLLRGGLFVSDEGVTRLNHAALLKIFVMIGVILSVISFSIAGSDAPGSHASNKAPEKSDVEMARPPAAEAILQTSKAR